MNKIDQAIFMWINQHRSPVLDLLMVKISDFGLFAPLLLAFVIYRLVKGSARERWMWIGCIITVILADALCARVLKPLFSRPRPYLTLDGVHLYKGHHWIVTTKELREHFSMNYSFPSCHASNTWAVTFFLLFFKRKIAAVAALVALLVSYSRVYLGVHYPFDCLGGLIVGCMVGGLTAWAVHFKTSGQSQADMTTV